MAEVIAQREFKRVLGDSEREALKAYPEFRPQVERVIEQAQRQSRKKQPQTVVN